MSFPSIKEKLTTFAAGLGTDQQNQLQRILEAAEASIKNPALKSGMAPKNPKIREEKSNSDPYAEAGLYVKPMSAHEVVGREHKPNPDPYEQGGLYTKPMSAHELVGHESKTNADPYEQGGLYVKPMSAHELVGRDDKTGSAQE